MARDTVLGRVEAAAKTRGLPRGPAPKQGHTNQPTTGCETAGSGTTKQRAGSGAPTHSCYLLEAVTCGIGEAGGEHSRQPPTEADDTHCRKKREAKFSRPRGRLVERSASVSQKFGEGKLVLLPFEKKASTVTLGSLTEEQKAEQEVRGLIPKKLEER